MGIICIALGEFVLTGSGQSEYFVAGHVLISLSAICLALFTTAFIIISQLTHGMNKFYERRINPEMLPYLEKKARKNNFALFTSPAPGACPPERCSWPRPGSCRRSSAPSPPLPGGARSPRTPFCSRRAVSGCSPSPHRPFYGLCQLQAIDQPEP